MTKRPSKILIIRFSSIGDILLTTPFIQQVRKTFPTAHISFLIKKEFSDLVKFNGKINEVIPFDSSAGYKGLKQLSEKIESIKFDLVFDLHNNIRSNRVTKNIDQEKTFKISKIKFKRFLLIYFKLNFFNQILMAPEKYLRVGGPKGIKDDGEKLELFWEGATASFIENLLLEKNIEKTRYLCFAPGAAHFTKMWPSNYIAELLKKTLMETNLKIVLVGGAGERRLLSEFNNETRILNLFGKLSLLETAAVINHSRGLITNDSGLMHMAVAVKKPIIAIFGSTTKELGFFPYRADATVIENEKLWCRPCTHMGRDFCPLGHFKCMNDIPVERVYNTIKDRFL